MSIEILDCLKRERDISIKAMSSGGKMVFRLTPPLREDFKKFRFAVGGRKHHFGIPRKWPSCMKSKIMGIRWAKWKKYI